MKRLIVTTTLALLAGTAIQASPMTDSIVQQLTDQGYTHIEVTVGPGQVKAEAVKGSTQREIVFDKATGKVLKDTTDAVQAGDNTAPGVEVGAAGQDFLAEDAGDDNGTDGAKSDDANDDNGTDDGDKSDANDDNGSDDNGSDDGGSDGGSDGGGKGGDGGGKGGGD